MARRRNPGTKARATSTTPIVALDHSDLTDEMKIDRALVGDSEIWPKLFDGQFKLAVRCSRCGRWLTNGHSKRDRLGPHCRTVVGQ